MTTAQNNRLNGLVGSAAIKLPVRVYSPSTLTLSGLQTIQGVTLVEGDRVGMFNNTLNAGIYIASSGQWKRSPDFNGRFDVARGTIIRVLEGTYAAYELEVTTQNEIVVDTHIVSVASRPFSSINTFITPQDFGAVADGVTDDSAAIIAAIATGRRIYFPKGDYVVTEEIELVTAGQLIEFEGTGGYGYGENVGLNWHPHTRIIAKGTFAKRVRTRRKFRGSSGDPQDDPLSCVLNVQAEGVVLWNPCVWLDCDYTDNSPTNFGANVDIGIFFGCRVGCQMVNPYVIGYYRYAGVLFDVTQAANLPRMLDKAGNPYAAGTVESGADGVHLWNPYFRGGRMSLAALGALPKTGETTYTDDYYDEQLGTTVPDNRGSFGFSDFGVYGGRIYGPDHHSNYRLKDPVLDGGLLTETSLSNEPDNAPCAMHISGLAGNASGNIWGMRFYGTRFATFEAFRIRLGYAARINFYSCHTEGRNGGRKDTAGNAVDTNDYAVNTYGDVAGTANTLRVRMIDSDSQTPTDGAFYHYYGTEKTLETAGGRYYVGDYVSASTGDLDLRGETAGDGINFRGGETSFGNLNATGFSFNGNIDNPVIASNMGELDLRAAENEILRGRHGNTTMFVVDPVGLVTQLYFNIRPFTDNNHTLGQVGSRWTEVFAANGTINTSDEREKEQIRDLSDSEKAVAVRLKGLIKAFKFKDAVLKKGDKARIHIGLMAQQVKEAFEAEGLDGFAYGLLCYDEWDYEPPKYDKDGILWSPEKQAGNRYGIRYEQLLTFIISVL